MQKAAAQKIAQTLIAAGHETYFAGGSVRDQLLGKEPKDYDVATSATPAEVQALFPRTDAVGAHFGVIIVKETPGIFTEVATFRTDGSYNDGRRPETVTFATAAEDAQRRDFTINGLFQHPETGEIIDHVGGKADLERRQIRAIGDPTTRFQEDALRLLRAIRFAVTTGFEIEPDTWAAIQENAPLLQKISPERIRDEFSKIITPPDSQQAPPADSVPLTRLSPEGYHPPRARALDLLVESNLVAQFLPELLECIGCEQPPKWHPEGDVYVHTKIALALLEKPTIELALSVLLHDIGKPPTQTWDEDAQRHRFNGHESVGAEMSQEILRRLRYPNQVIDDVSFAVSRHMKFMHVQDMRTAKLKRFMSAPRFDEEIELHRVDCDSSNGFRDNYDFLLQKKEEFANEPLIPKPILNGRDLMTEFQLNPGPDLGKILRLVQTEQLENRLTSREDALAFVKDLLQKQ